MDAAHHALIGGLADKSKRPRSLSRQPALLVQQQPDDVQQAACKRGRAKRGVGLHYDNDRLQNKYVQVALYILQADAA